MKKLALAAVACLLLCTATIANAQSRRQPFKFELTALDAKTLRPRATFVLGESVAIRFSLTNQTGVARKIPVLADHYMPFKLHSTEPYEHHPEVTEGGFGGTGWVRTEGSITFWGSSPPRMMILKPGQTVSRVMYLDGLQGHPLDEGTHTLTANYNERLRTTIQFQVIVDREKSIPLLEQLAAAPGPDGRDTLRRWASANLNLVREPSISGRIVDDKGQPLNEVGILITGALNSNTETRKNGRYKIDGLKKGGTYTITPEIQFYNDPGETDYTLAPASRTITVQDGEISDVNFIATRVRIEKNFALDDEGARVKASSIRDWMFEPENAIDRYRMVPVGQSQPEYWNDGTPNKFPDWLQVDFGVTRKIDWINVFTLPDSLDDPPDPEPDEKFRFHGITDFDVQYWTGRAWRTVPGGAIRNNRKVWRKISFPEITTNKIRVVVLNALGGESRITEIEAVHLNDLPEAKITVAGGAKKITGYTDSPVQFHIAAHDRDGVIQNLEIDFDDGPAYEWRRNPQKPGDKPLLTHSHLFGNTGTYKVKLTVMDDSEEYTEATVVLTIIERPEKKVRVPKTSRR